MGHDVSEIKAYLQARTTDRRADRIVLFDPRMRAVIVSSKSLKVSLVLTAQRLTDLQGLFSVRHRVLVLLVNQA